MLYDMLWGFADADADLEEPCNNVKLDDEI